MRSCEGLHMPSLAAFPTDSRDTLVTMEGLSSCDAGGRKLGSQTYFVPSLTGGCVRLSLPSKFSLAPSCQELAWLLCRELHLVVCECV